MKQNQAITLLLAAILLPLALKAQTVSTNAAVRKDRDSSGQVQIQLKQIMHGINTKMVARQGNISAGDLAEDVQAIDKLIADHRGQKTDELAQAALVKAMLYGSLLDDKATAKALEKQLKQDFDGTAFVGRLEREEEGDEEEGKEALEIGLPFFPDFYASDIQGKPLSVSQFKGKVVLVYCWSSWWQPCVRQLPELTGLYQKYHPAGLEIIGISLDSDRAKFDEFLKAHPEMNWPQYYDGLSWQNRISSKYGIRNIPYAILVNADGEVVAKWLRGKDLVNAVDDLFKPKPGTR